MSGFGVYTAVDMINSALCLKLDYECFSTIDLLCIDLMTGVCEFFKIGGAESIVSELDKAGIIAFEVSVIESGHGKIEVYLGVNKGMETGKIEAALEAVLETPMAYRMDSAGGLMKFTSRARYSADIGIRQISCDYTDVSGDCIDSFATDDYKHYIIISDGMGSGRRAMTESHITLKL